MSLIIAMALQAATTTTQPSDWRNRPHRGGMHDGMHGGMNREQRMDRFFAMADSNHDGQLSKAELEAARAKMRARHEQRMQRGGWNRQGMQNGYGQQPAPQR